MLGYLLPFLHMFDHAEQVLSQAVALSEAHGDELHLSAALNNRFNLWAARRHPAGAAEDLRRSVRIKRELGMISREQTGEFNLAELYYQTGDFGSAWAHLKRALAINERHPAEQTLNLSLRLLEARLFTCEAREQQARELIAEIRAHQHSRECLPQLQMQLDMIDCATRDTTDVEWERLQQRATQLSLSYERVEMLELRAVRCGREGRAQEMSTWLEQALEIASEHPTFLEGRIRKRLEELRAVNQA